MDCGEQCGRNGGSGDSARRQDDTLVHWWEAVPPFGLFFRLALGGDNRVERFRSVQPGCQVIQDARETHVVLWSRFGQRGEIDVYPTTEPDARACPLKGRLEPR